MNLIVLEENKAILRVMGLLSGSGIRKIFSICMWSTPLILLFIPCLSYSLVNISDIRKSTEAMYVTAADLLCICQYWFLVAQKQELLAILRHLDQLVENRMTFFF